MVISAILLPVLDGIELIKGVRRVDIHVPIIVSCNNRSTELISKDKLIHDTSVSCILEKPIKWKKLAGVLKKLLKEPEKGKSKVVKSS